MGILAKGTKSVILTAIILGVTLGIVGVAMALEVGDKAPDFTLQSTTGEKITLSEFRGKNHVLIEFYAIDFHPAWTPNLSARKADYSKFKELNVELLGISSGDPFTQKTFADSLQLPYPLLSDHPDPKVIRTYGIIRASRRDPKRLLARGSFFLIDKQGIVRGKWFRERGKVFPNERLLQAARQLEGKI